MRKIPTSACAWCEEGDLEISQFVYCEKRFLIGLEKWEIIRKGRGGVEVGNNPEIIRENAFIPHGLCYKCEVFLTD